MELLAFCARKRTLKHCEHSTSARVATSARFERPALLATPSFSRGSRMRTSSPNDSLQGPRGLAAAPPADTERHSDYSTGENISGASHRLRALAALSGSLTDALSPEEA